MTVDDVDAASWRYATGASGVLRTFNDADVIEAADVLVAQRLAALAGEADETVALAVAFVVRAVRAGSVCVDLTAVQAQVDHPDLDWPASSDWVAAVAASPRWVRHRFSISRTACCTLTATGWRSIRLPPISWRWPQRRIVAEHPMPQDFSRISSPSSALPPRLRCPGA